MRYLCTQVKEFEGMPGKNVRVQHTSHPRKKVITRKNKKKAQNRGENSFRKKKPLGVRI